MREIIGFAGHAAITVDGKRDPIFNGITASGYRREYTLSELTREEKKDVAERRLQEWRGTYGPLTPTQASNVVAAVAVYGEADGLDRLLDSITRP